MAINLIFILFFLVLTFPLSHIFMKKAIVLDYNITKNFHKKLYKIFYIPFLNVIVSFLYLIWVIVKFKRPE